MLKHAKAIKLDSDLFLVSSNNGSEVPAKKLHWMRSFFLYKLAQIVHVKSTGLNHTSPRFRTTFWRLSTFGLLEITRSFLLSSRHKNLASVKNISSLLNFRKVKYKNAFLRHCFIYLSMYKLLSEIVYKCHENLAEVLICMLCWYRNFSWVKFRLNRRSSFTQ